MRCTGYEMARNQGTQASHLYEKSMHTPMYNQWATAPGRSLNYPRPKSITHLRTFSDNGVCSFTAILSNSSIWPVTPGINTLLLSTDALEYFTWSGMTLPIYMGPMALRDLLLLVSIISFLVCHLLLRWSIQCFVTIGNVAKPLYCYSLRSCHWPNCLYPAVIAAKSRLCRFHDKYHVCVGKPLTDETHVYMYNVSF